MVADHHASVACVEIFSDGIVEGEDGIREGTKEFEFRQGEDDYGVAWY